MLCIMCNGKKTRFIKESMMMGNDYTLARHLEEGTGVYQIVCVHVQRHSHNQMWDVLRPMCHLYGIYMGTIWNNEGKGKTGGKRGRHGTNNNGAS